jgi:hypothetical protein
MGMRARLALLVLFACACTRDNPAFGESTSTAATTTDGDDTSTTRTTDVESGEGQEAPDPVCELQPGVPLEIDLGPAGCADTPETYDRYHPLVSIDGSTLFVGTCPLDSVGCSDQCESDIPTPLSFAPLDLTNIAAPDDCLHIQARRLNPSNPDLCRFQSVVIESANTGTPPRPLMVGRNASGVGLPPINDASPLVGFDPALVHVESCACADFPSECCDGVEPTVYALGIGQQDVVHIGETALLESPDGSYAFTTLDAFQPGECGKPRQEAWGLVTQ